MHSWFPWGNCANRLGVMGTSIIFLGRFNGYLDSRLKQNSKVVAENVDSGDSDAFVSDESKAAVGKNPWPGQG